jgi:hypothetical protein
MRDNVTVSVTFSTTMKASNPDAYRITMTNCDDDVTGRLEKIGATENGIARYRGTFPSMRDALRAVGDYIEAPHQVYRITGPTDATIKVARIGEKPTTDEFHTARCLYRRTYRGEFLFA